MSYFVDASLAWWRTPGTNGDGVIASIVATVILSLFLWTFNATVSALRGGRFFTLGTGQRSIAGYVVGWLFMSAFSFAFLYYRKSLTPGTVLPLYMMTIASVPMIGWLDRYDAMRRAFAGKSWYESIMMPVVGYLGSCFLTWLFLSAGVVALRGLGFS